MPDYRIAVAEVRLRVDSEEEAAAVILAMQHAHGNARVALRVAPGRAGVVFVRGTLQFQVGEEPTIEAPPSSPATGRTMQLAATGKTRRLRRQS